MNKNLIKFLLLGLMFFTSSCYAIVTVTNNADGTRSLNFPSNTIGGSASTYNVAPNGASVLTPVTPVSTNPNYGGFTYEPAPTGGGLKATGTFNYPVGNTGASMPVEVSSGISKAALALAVGRIIGGPAGTIAALAIPALVDWLKRNDVEPLPDGSGFGKPDPTVCTVAPCYNYRTPSYWTASLLFPSVLANCQANYDNRVAAGYKMVNPVVLTNGGLSCTFSYEGCVSTCGVDMTPEKVSVEPNSTAPKIPMSPAEIVDKIGKPESAVPTPAVAPGVLGGGQDLPASGLTPDAPPIAVSGPASVPGTTSTTTAPNGDVTTTTTTYNNTYADNKVETTLVTNSLTTYVTGGSSTIINSSPAPLPLPADDPCLSNPDRLGCMVNGGNVSPDVLPTLSVPVAITPVLFASPASCPPPLTGQINVGSFVKAWEFKFDPMCNLMTTLRPLFLSIGAAAAAWLFMEGLKA